MSKKLNDKSFFTREAKEVAKDLLGKYICSNYCKKFQIVATEAYYHEETDEVGKKICYGVKKTDVTAALYDRPGTWCIYHGQLLLSVMSDQFPDNVLIKAVKGENGEILGPDKMAYALCLYKSKPGYCNCSGQHSLDTESDLYLTDGEKPVKVSSFPRINIKSKEQLRFVIVDE